MIDEKTIFEIHRLKDEGHSYRRIAGILGISRESAAKYHQSPDIKRTNRKKKPSKLDVFKGFIDEMLAECDDVSAVVVLQKLRQKGFKGQLTIVRAYLRHKRQRQKARQVFIRFESEPGQQMQVDWGHFDRIDYEGDKRKLYALAVVETYSRRLYVQFTHSQKQETLHQCLFDAFCFFKGTPQS